MVEDSALGVLPGGVGGSTDDRSPRAYAALATGGAVATAVGLAAVGYALGVQQQGVVTLVVTVVVLGLLAGGFALFRAMAAAAERSDGAAEAALTHPAFVALFVFVVLTVAVYLAFLYDQFLA